jgi:DNA-binding CsgD family transcriptional regulator
MQLTKRESEVLAELMKGSTNAEIGSKLGISIKTIENTVRNMMLKTGAKNRVDLAMKKARGEI